MRQDEGVVVLGVNLTQREGNEADVQAFVDEFGVTFSVVLDEEGEEARAYDPAAAERFFDVLSDVERIFDLHFA